MEKLRLIILLVILTINSAYCEVKLFESPIEFKIDTGCKLNEFCEKYIDNIDIEKFIKTEIENDYHVVSLDECLDIALFNNFKIRIADHTYKSSRYEYQYSLSKFLPLFNTTSYIADYQGQILVGGVLRDTFHETAISVNLTAEHYLTKGGQEIFEARAAGWYKKSKKHLANFTKTEVIYLTSKYYYEMLLAKINIEIYLRNLIERNAQLALANNLKNSGFGTHFDVIRSQNESADAKNKLLKALNDFRLSQTKLANIMGINVETALMPFEKEVSIMNLIDSNLDINELFEIAQTKREDLKSYKDLIKYQQNIKNSYVTDFFPKPLVNFQQQFQGTISTTTYPNYILTGLIHWQPGEYLSVGTIKKIQREKENIKIRKLEYENKLRDIKENIIVAYSTSGFTEKEISINKKRTDYANESIKLAMLRFNNGKGILLDVIQAQSEMTTARVQYVASIINHNISQLELSYNIGTITKDLILENYKP